MAKTDTFQMRIEPELKANVDNIFDQLGITTTDAINMFFKQVLIKGGMPFDVRLPESNITTKQAMKEAEEIANSGNHKFSSPEEMFKALGI